MLTVGEARMLRVVRTLLILAMVIAPIAVGTMWRMLLSARVGTVNRMLAGLGITGPDWLGDPTLAVVSLVFIDAWEWIPFVTVIYVAALSSLPSEPLLAAEVDGATRWQVFRYVVWPMLLPMTLLVTMFRLIDALLTLDVVFTTTYGGPGFRKSWGPALAVSGPQHATLRALHELVEPDEHVRRVRNTEPGDGGKRPAHDRDDDRSNADDLPGVPRHARPGAGRSPGTAAECLASPRNSSTPRPSRAAAWPALTSPSQTRPTAAAHRFR